MKSNRIDKAPDRVEDLGNGTSHFNFNVLEATKDGVLSFDYDQVAVENPATYEKIVIALIRERYSVNDELAIIRQQASKPDEFNAYFDFVESCKLIARDE